MLMETVPAFFTSYPYLFANLLTLVLLILCIKKTWKGGQGRIALLSGLMCIPFSLVSLLHEGQYWNPLRWGGGPFGAEDIRFCINAGILVLFLATGPFVRTITIDVTMRQLFRRYLLVLLPGSGAFLILFLSHGPAMTGTLLIMITAVLIFIGIRHDNLPLSIRGVILFLPVYLILVGIEFAVWPSYIHSWSSPTIWDHPVLGIPAGEIAWAAAFGALWPLLVAYSLDIRGASSGTPD